MSLIDASACLVAAFQKHAADLAITEHALEAEFRRRYAGEVNPMDLLHKLRKLRRDLPHIQRDCQAVLAAKQELVDAARSGVLSSQRALAALQAKAGLPINAPSSNNVFSAAMDEFDRVMRSGEYGDQQVDEDKRNALNAALVQTVL